MNYQVTKHLSNHKTIAEVISDTLLITDTQSSFQLMADLYYEGYDSIIIHLHNLTTDFFDLQNGLAGEILQKYSNYRIQLGIVGDFSQYQQRKSVADFIRESNNRKQVVFVDSTTNAIQLLTA